MQKNSKSGSISALQEPISDLLDIPRARRADGERPALQRFALTCAGALGMLGLLTLTGCPADLENPERFDQPGLAGGSPVGAGGSPVVAGGGGTTVDTTCLTQLFSGSCTVCHFAGTTFGGEFDLKTDDVASRLVNIGSKHLGGVDQAKCPKGDKLVDTANPAASWLLLKVSGGQGSCGTSMPPGGTVSAAEKACVNNFVNAEAAAMGAPKSGAGGAAAASGTPGVGTAGTGGT